MMTAEQFFFFSGVELKAQRALWRKYGINRHELSALLAFSSFCMLHGRKVATVRDVVLWLGLRGEMKRLYNGYLWGCIKHGYLHRLRYKSGRLKTGANSLGLSGYGGRILLDYWAELEKWERSRAKVGAVEPVEKGLVISPENVPSRYVLVERGRME